MSSESAVQAWISRMTEILGTGATVTSGETKEGVHTGGVGRSHTSGDLDGDHRTGTVQVQAGTDGVVGVAMADQLVNDDKEDGIKVTEGTKASVTNKGMSASRAKEISLTDEETKEAASFKKEAAANVDFEKKQLDVTFSDSTEQTKDEKTVSGSSTSTTIKVGADGTGVGKSSSTTERDDEGVAVTNTRSGQVTHKGASGSIEKTKKHDDGFETSQAASAGVNFEERSVDVSYKASQATKNDPDGGDDDDNKTKSSVAVNAKAKAYEGSGGELTAGIDIAHGKWKTGASMTLKQGWKITKNDENEYVVEWVKGFGFAKSMGVEGKRAGGSVGGNVFDETSFTMSKTFKSQKEAVDWCQLHGQPPLGDTADSARDMAAGSTVTDHDGYQLTADAKLMVYGVTVGAEVRWGESTMVLIEKTTEESVIVKFLDIDEIGLGASLSALIGIEVSWSDKDIGFSEASFDILTEDGGKAFESFRKTGKFPGGKGCKLLRKGKTNVDTDTLKLKFGLFDLTDSDTVTRTVEVDADGTKRTIDRGEANFGGDSPFEFMGKHKEKHVFEAVTVEGQDEPSYVIRSEIDSSSVHGNARVLTDVADDEFGPGAYKNRGDAEGKWTVELKASPAQMKLFMDLVASGKSNNALLMYDKGEAEDLGKALRQAKSLEEKHAALSEFFANTGSAGIEFAQVTLRDHAGGKMAVNLDLESWKDQEDVWLATKELDEFIARVEKVTISSPAERDDAEAMLAELRDLKAELDKRLNRLSHKGQYVEVPVKLRRGYVAKLEALKTPVTEQMEYLHTSMEELAGGECTPEDETAEFHTKEARLWMKQAQDEMDYIHRARDAAKRSDTAHGYVGMWGGFRDSDYEEVPFWFNPNMASHYEKKYSQVKSHLKKGDKTWNDAAEAVDDVVQYANYVLNDPLNEELFLMLSDTFTDSMAKLRVTSEAFESAYEILHEIYSNHKDHKNFSKGYPERATR